MKIERFEDLWNKKQKKEKKRYEYRCFWCGFINIRYEPTARIVCDRCHKTFYG